MFKLNFDYSGGLSDSVETVETVETVDFSLEYKENYVLSCF